MHALNIFSVLSPVSPAEVKLLSFRRNSMGTCLERLTFVHVGLYNGENHQPLVQCSGVLVRFFPARPDSSCCIAINY